jgi:hypothetical protein
MGMSHGMKLVVAGCAIGLVAAIVGWRMIASPSYGIDALKIAAYRAQKLNICRSFDILCCDSSI